MYYYKLISTLLILFVTVLLVTIYYYDQQNTYDGTPNMMTMREGTPPLSMSTKRSSSTLHLRGLGKRNNNKKYGKTSKLGKQSKRGKQLTSKSRKAKKPKNLFIKSSIDETAASRDLPPSSPTSEPTSGSTPSIGIERRILLLVIL